MNKGLTKSKRGRTALNEAELVDALLEVRSLDKLPDSTILAVAVRRFGGNWCHAALVVRHENDDGSLGPAMLFHLKWHHDLAWEIPEDGYYFAVPPVPDERVVHVVALCDMVRDKYKGTFPFAVQYQDERFDPQTGEYLTKGGRGLTCATFVLAVFRSMGIVLLAIDQWQLRDDDRKWHEQIVSDLRKSGADPDHVAAVASQSPCARFRPQEILAAVIAEVLPISFAYGEPTGEAVRVSIPIAP